MGVGCFKGPQEKGADSKDLKKTTNQKVDVKTQKKPPKIKDIERVIVAKDFPQNNPTSANLISLTAMCKTSYQERVKVRIPQNTKMISFVEVDEPTIFFPPELAQTPIKEIKTGTFQQKMSWFRINLEKRRISWEKGSQKLCVDRSNILFSSIEALKKINLNKELKIKFNDDKVEDAGGLLREWMHLCIKQIFSPSNGSFQLCCTDETAYKIVWDTGSSEQLIYQTMDILGLLIGKALFQRISLNCFLNRTLIRQLLGQPVHSCDLYSFDRDFYNSWAQMLELPDADNLFLNFSLSYINKSNGMAIQKQLITNGKQILVTDQNKLSYVKKMIELYCITSVEKYIHILKKSLYSVIPQQYLTIFHPHEFQMLLNGPKNIDLNDWKQNTVYEGFSPQQNMIVWFWEEVAQYGQKQFANFLHYCTGSTRIPVLGFKYLESNRGEIRKFTIRKVQKYEKKNPYPKAYTCFNRLEMPVYETKEQLGNLLRLIMFEEISHFGFD